MTDEEFAQQVFAVPVAGIAAGVRLVALHSFVLEMHKIHGLDISAPLTLSEVQRAAGTIVQSISEADGEVTYVRA